MPFIDLDEVKPEFVTPKHSTAFGPLVTGEAIEVGRLRYKAGEGAQRHEHPQEQIIVVISGRVRIQLGDDIAELGPGSGFHAPPWVPHQMWVLEDAEVISCKSVVDGAGHRI
jgi:quercetin dioxygenase-like cupin family protein